MPMRRGRSCSAGLHPLTVKTQIATRAAEIRLLRGGSCRRAYLFAIRSDYHRSRSREGVKKGGSGRARIGRLAEPAAGLGVEAWDRHGRVLPGVAALGVRRLLERQEPGVHATTLEANAAMKSIERLDDGANYDDYVRQLMQSEGVEEPTPAQRQRFDRKRKKSLSNREWVNPHDPEARITKMKDARTHLAYKAEHVVDLDTGAVVALTVQPADRADTESLRATLGEAGGVVAGMAGQAGRAEAGGPVKEVSEVGVERVVADKGYHSKQVLEELPEVGAPTRIAEPERKRQRWAGQRTAQAALYADLR
jgi:transposase